MVRINQLPDLCLQVIFSNLPNNQLLLIRGVCHHWLIHQQINSRTRQTLILGQQQTGFLIKSSPFDAQFYAHQIIRHDSKISQKAYVKRNQVKLAKIITQESVQFIVQNFPQIHTLIILHRDKSYDFIVPLGQLLQHYSPLLHTLQLHFDFLLIKFSNKYQKEPVYLIPLISKLNTLKALKHLTLRIHAPPIDPNLKDLEFLKHLQQFYCYQPRISCKWFDALKTFSKRDEISNLKEIGFGADRWSEDIDKSILNISSQFADRFTHLTFPGVFPTDLRRFHSLVSIRFNRFSTLSNFLQVFSSLTNLVHIRFYLDKSFFTNSMKEDISSKPTQTFPYIKAIDFVLNHLIDCDFKIEQPIPNLAAFFPAVESIRIIDFRYYHLYNLSHYWNGYEERHANEIEQIEGLIGKPNLKIRFAQQHYDIKNDDL